MKTLVKVMLCIEGLLFALAATGCVTVGVSLPMRFGASEPLAALVLILLEAGLVALVILYAWATRQARLTLQHWYGRELGERCWLRCGCLAQAISYPVAVVYAAADILLAKRAMWPESLPRMGDVALISAVLVLCLCTVRTVMVCWIERRERQAKVVRFMR